MRGKEDWCKEGQEEEQLNKGEDYEAKDKK
jgi:hypothetical protein